jgi:WD40 repeat protein
VRLHDLDTSDTHTFRGHGDVVSALAFSPDGEVLASGSLDHTLRLWSVSTGESRRIDAGGSGITQLGFAAGGRTVITLSKVETGVRLWDATTGAERGLLRGHGGEVTRFAVAPEGSRLATASVDGTVRLWDLATGESRALTGHGGLVHAVAFSGDGLRVTSAGEDRTVRLWSDDLPSDAADLRAWLGAPARPEDAR